MPVHQFGKHKACADETDHGQHLPTLRWPSPAANGKQQITSISRFSTAVRAEAVQPHHLGGNRESLSDYHEMAGDAARRLDEKVKADQGKILTMNEITARDTALRWAMGGNWRRREAGRRRGQPRSYVLRRTTDCQQSSVDARAGDRNSE